MALTRSTATGSKGARAKADRAADERLTDDKDCARVRIADPLGEASGDAGIFELTVLFEAGVGH